MAIMTYDVRIHFVHAGVMPRRYTRSYPQFARTLLCFNLDYIIS